MTLPVVPDAWTAPGERADGSPGAATSIVVATLYGNGRHLTV